jgi:selT/selW/selH-like putative selenoprotein
LAEPQDQLKKAIFLIFVILVAIDIIPRFSNPATSPSENTAHNQEIPYDQQKQTQSSDDKYESKSRAYQANDEAYIKDDYYRDSYHSKTKDFEKKDDFGFTDTVKILSVQYCTSWSYRQNYEQLAQYLSRKYPTLIFEGSEYPVDPIKALLSKVVGLIQYGLYAILFAGQFIFNKLGMPPPAFYYRLTQNKVLSFFIIMLVGSNIQSLLTKTGAFEIYLNNSLIFSKLRTGEMPSLEGIDRVLQEFNI